MEFHRNNHFVPQTYLKRWSFDGKRIWGYPLLVPHINVPAWSLYSIRGIAYRTHLYTKLALNGEETDEFERWLDKEFESPGLWLFEIKHILTNTAKVLLRHKWSIMYPFGLEWFTSDDSVICLNYYKKGSYDFSGGWGNKGSEILFPISPNHMLYTKVGEKSASRIKASKELSIEVQQRIAEHAHRWIFSKEPIKNIESLRQRRVDSITFKQEKEAWEGWNDDQINAERNLMRKLTNPNDE
jgi:hypothetical protein